MNDGLSIASIIISVVALLAALGCLVIMLAKNVFSSHSVQMVPVDPMAQLQGMMPPGLMGNPMENDYKELGDPISSEELEHLENLKRKASASKMENKDVV